MEKYLRYYWLEEYLFGTVRPRFHKDKQLGAFDFFSIIVWKANRAKSKVASRLRDRDSLQRRNLDAIVATVTRALAAAPDAEGRFKVLVGQWGLRLPMASAVLSVLWPDGFSVYDRLVCDELQEFHGLGAMKNNDQQWKGYQEFVARVRSETPRHLTLRDKDRYLWARSRSQGLAGDIKRGFSKRRTDA